MKEMKILFILSTILFVSFEIIGQPQKSDVMLGSNLDLNFNFHKFQDKTKVTNLGFAPKLGFFSTNNFIWGFQIPFNFESVYNDDYNFKGSSYTFGIVPFLRCYFGKTKIKPYLYGEFGYGFSKSEYIQRIWKRGLNWSHLSNYTGQYKGHLYTYKLGGGISLFIHKRFCIDIEVGYGSNYYKPMEETVDDHEEFRNDLDFRSGFALIF